jgi:carboxymethylenebutenolidase
VGGLLAVLAGQALAVEVKTQDITFKSGDEEIQGFLAVAEGKGPFPALVVIHEVWGLTDWIKDNAKRLAAKGYVALAADLYRGKVPGSLAEGRQMMSALPQDRALRDLKAAVDALAVRKVVKQERLGVVGWCAGGAYALKLALRNQRIKACAICYGRVVNDPDQLRPLAAPVLRIFGSEDKGIPPKLIHEFEAAMKQANKTVSIYTFDGAGHAFMRPQDPAYNADAAKEAWQRIDRFFAGTLAR